MSRDVVSALKNVVSALKNVDSVVRLVGDGRCLTAAFPTTPVRVTGMWGSGTLRYVTADGWAGVHLDGERTVTGRDRIDEFPVEHLRVLMTLT